MSHYPDIIALRSIEPRFSGSSAEPSATGASANFSCGSVVRFEFIVERETTLIESIRFRSNGCGFMVAAADLLSERFAGKHLTELHGADTVEIGSSLIDRIDQPVDRVTCLETVVEAFRDALANYRHRMVEEFRGEKPLICTCFGVTEDTIINVIETIQPADVREVSSACNAGTGCGSCQMLIAELIDAYRT